MQDVPRGRVRGDRGCGTPSGGGRMPWLSHAKTADRRRGACGDDGPLDSPSSAPGNPLAELSERLSAAAEYEGEVVPFYPSPLPKTDENALYIAVAQVALDNNTGTGATNLAAELVRSF